MKTHRVLPRSLTLCVIAVCTLHATAQRGSGATITVNSLSDVQANDGVCTLREAIANANGDNQSGSTDCAAGSGADTINISVAGTITLDSSLPILTTDMTINGLGADQTILKGPSNRPVGSFRIFSKNSGTATISNMTIRDGAAPVGPAVNGIGGGIFNFGGPLTLSSVIVTNNVAVAVDNPNGAGGISTGGGIVTFAPLTVNNSTIFINGAFGGKGSTGGGQAEGGGIYAQDAGAVTINNSVIKQNIVQGGNGTSNGDGAFSAGSGICAVGATTVSINSGSQILLNGAYGGTSNVGIAGFSFGAGIYSASPLTINDSTVSSNVGTGGTSNGGPGGSALGAGIYSASPLTINGSTVDSNILTSGNSTNNGSGPATGGGIYSDAALTLNNTEVGYNSINPAGGLHGPGGAGGGIYSRDSGTVSITNSTIRNNTINAYTVTNLADNPATGGGIFVDRTTVNTTLTISGSRIISNRVVGATTNTAGASRGGYAEGGGLSVPVFVTTTITNSLFNNNSVQGGDGMTTGLGMGGGIFNGSTMSISNSQINGNSVTDLQTYGVGGGIYNTSGNTAGILTITDSTLSGNSAINGGAIENDATVNLLRSTISGNSASSPDDSSGGFDNNVTLTATNSTFSGNLTPHCGDPGNLGQCGGGIWSRGTLTLTNCTVTNNQPIGPNSAGGVFRYNGTVNIKDTIIAGNINNNNFPDVFHRTAGTTGSGFVSQGYNLIGNIGSVTSFTQTGDQTGNSATPLNPMLGALVNNGGPTQTHKPLSGSPVIDKGAAATDPITNTAITNDQRSFRRPLDFPAIPNAPGGNGSDIGAVERDVIPVLTVTKTADTNDGICDADCSLREALTVAASDGLADVIVFNIPANSPGCTGTDCTITLTSPLTPAADGSLPTTINGYTGPNTITLSGNNTTQLLHLFGGANLVATNLNFTGGNGSAIQLDNGGTLTLTNSALFGNIANNGGAFFLNTGSVLNMTNVTISGNSTTSFGSGGGIWNAGGAITALNCTIANNSARNDGGVVTFNGGTFTTRNTIIATNTAIVNPDAFGSFASLGHNIIGNTTGNSGFTGAGDQTGVNPQLASLGNNGGPTQTHALQSNSPAINAGDNTYAPAYDQRYLLRNGTSDIGAYEFNGLTPSLKITSITHLATGEFILQGLGVVSAPHTVQVSSNLTSGFSYLATTISDATGTVRFDDEGAIGATKRFYRLSFP